MEDLSGITDPYEIFALGFSSICIVRELSRPSLVRATPTKLLEIRHGAGRHLWDVPLENFKMLLKVSIECLFAGDNSRGITNASVLSDRSGS